jgi:heavy metal sensor kinase
MSQNGTSHHVSHASRRFGNKRRWPGPRLNTLRVRLALWYVLVFALVLAIFSFSIYSAGTRNLRAEVDRLLVDEAHQVLNSLATGAGPPELRPGFSRLASGTLVALYDPSGRQRLAGQALPNEDSPALLPPDQAASDLDTARARTVTVAEGDNWRVLLVPVRDDTGQTVALVQVARSERDVEIALHNLGVALSVILPATLLLATIGGIFLVGRMLDPIDRITLTAERISNGQDLSQRIGLPPRDDEVGRLAATFDHMLARLDLSFQQQRRFTADASHELRTPLALVMSQLDVALSQDRTAEEYRAVLVSTREDVQRLARLVDELLALARADAAQDAMVREPLDLQEIAEDVSAAMAPLAEAAEVALECLPGSPVPIEGDQAGLTQLVVNLADNAIKYTSAGGRVCLSASADGDWALLRVSDTGIGIAPEHLPHLFERFYRVDKARSRAAGGTGLGLAFCRWMAGTHDGSIEVESEPGVGSTFTVRLPMTTRPPASLVAGRGGVSSC